MSQNSDDFLVLVKPFDETAALKSAASFCERSLLRTRSSLSSVEDRFRECVLQEVAGYLLRAGEHLPQNQWLVGSLGMSSLEYQIEGWNALTLHKYRVAAVLLRPTFEAAVYMIGCAIVPTFVERWFDQELKPGTVSEILKALRRKKDTWANELRFIWGALNELAHNNFLPNVAATINIPVSSSELLPGISIGGGVFIEPVARYLSALYQEVAKTTLMAQGLCFVAPRDNYPSWYERHDLLLSSWKVDWEGP